MTDGLYIIGSAQEHSTALSVVQMNDNRHERQSTHHRSNEVKWDETSSYIYIRHNTTSNHLVPSHPIPSPSRTYENSSSLTPRHPSQKSQPRRRPYMHSYRTEKNKIKAKPDRAKTCPFPNTRANPHPPPPPTLWGEKENGLMLCEAAAHQKNPEAGGMPGDGGSGAE
jgi:hypothetical protein